MSGRGVGATSESGPVIQPVSLRALMQAELAVDEVEFRR